MSLNPLLVGTNVRWLKKPPDDPDFDFEGRARVTPTGSGSNKPPVDWARLCEEEPRIGVYYYPDRNPQVEEHVLRSLVSNGRFLPLPMGKTERNYYWEATEAMADDVVRLGNLDLPEWFSRGYPNPDDVFGAIVRLRPDSNSGYPMNHSGVLKRHHALQNFAEVYQAVTLKILLLRAVDASGMDPRDVESTHLREPAQCMLKNEMIKASKQCRMILVCSYLDELVERLLGSWLSDFLIEHWGESYSCIGIGFDEPHADKYRTCSPSGPRLYSDVPKFDFSTTEEEQVAFSKFVIAVALRAADRLRFRIHHSIRTILRNIAYAASRSTVLTSLGKAFAWLAYGKQLSGRYWTSVENTFIRAFRALVTSLWVQTGGDPTAITDYHLTALELIKAAGDDCGEDPLDKADAYEHFGWQLRDAHVSDVATFCSHVFPPSGPAYGTRLWKAVATLLYEPFITVEHLGGFHSDFGGHPEYAQAVNFLTRHRFDGEAGPVIAEMPNALQSMADLEGLAFQSLDVDVLRLPGRDPELEPLSLVVPEERVGVFDDDRLFHIEIEWEDGAMLEADFETEVAADTFADLALLLDECGYLPLSKKRARKIGTKQAPMRKKGTPRQKGNGGIVRVSKAFQPKKSTMGATKDKVPQAFGTAVCGQVDAFCSAALGARIPDGNAGRSFTYQIRGTFTLATNAAGSASVIILPYMPYNYVIGTGAGTTITFTGATMNQLSAATTMNSLISGYRIVTFGVRVASILSSTNNSGSAVVSTTSYSPASVVTPDLEFDDSRMFALNDFKGATWMAKRLANYFQYKGNNSSTYAAGANDDYPCCLIQLAGCTASVTAVMVEVVYNLEAVPLSDTAGTMLSQKTKPRNDGVLTAASVAQNRAPGTFMTGVEDAGKAVEDIVMSTPLGGIAKAGEALLKLL